MTKLQVETKRVRMRKDACTECGKPAETSDGICYDCCDHPKEDRECTTCNACGDTVR